MMWSGSVSQSLILVDRKQIEYAVPFVAKIPGARVNAV